MLYFSRDNFWCFYKNYQSMENQKLYIPKINLPHQLGGGMERFFHNSILNEGRSSLSAFSHLNWEVKIRYADLITVLESKPIFEFYREKCSRITRFHFKIYFGWKVRRIQKWPLLAFFAHLHTFSGISVGDGTISSTYSDLAWKILSESPIFISGEKFLLTSVIQWKVEIIVQKFESLTFDDEYNSESCSLKIWKNCH